MFDQPDGCSGGMSSIWRALFCKAPPWEGCCNEHDEEYAKGGTRRDRARSDARLLGCVANNGHPVWAILMWIAVRIGGHPALPFPWRWGFSGRWRPTHWIE